MTETENFSSAGTVRHLSESEIQDRLYGSYLGKRRLVQQTVAAPPAPAHPRPQQTRAETEWTGSEILSGELRRLRSELISLRQEKERLSVRLQQVSQTASTEHKSGLGIGRWFARSVSLFLLIGAVGYLVGGKALQASPSLGDATPFTVQVAVHDGRRMAEQTERFLKELGYDAFLVETPRGLRSSRYRVYVGSFVTKEEANRESQRLTADTRFRDFKDAFVLVR